MELVNPVHCIARSTVLQYISAMESRCQQFLFDFRMPEKFEVRKYGSTLLFLRKLMETCGYELIPRQQRNPPSEMEALTNWLIDPNTPLAHEHPEFGMLRDMTLVFKFLATMEPRDEELMRRRMPVREYAPWSLSFDEGGRRGWFSLRPQPLVWEIVGVRGADLDIADLDVTGFGERKLAYGEGPIVHSPCDPSRHIDAHPPVSEEDVLHADLLPTFGDTLSREESEMLISYLTVDYVRIPLVLGFFASRDRVTYLFNPQLQHLLRAVVFEPGPWVPASDTTRITHVPIRQTAEQQRQSRIDRFLLANLPPDRQLLGTNHGLLLNELICSPMAVLNPLMIMLEATKELTEASIYSPDATFILYILQLTLDVQGFVVHVLQSLRSGTISVKTTSSGTSLAEELTSYNKKIHEYLHGVAFRTLTKWCAEAEDESDMLSTSVVHSFIALLFTNLLPEEITESTIVTVLGSLSYVRNWHGFGLGLMRSELESHGSNTLQDAEQRLIRFLQAQVCRLCYRRVLLMTIILVVVETCYLDHDCQ